MVCALNYLVSWIDFGTRVCQTRVPAQNSNYNDVFLSGVCRKRPKFDFQAYFQRAKSSPLDLNC